MRKSIIVATSLLFVVATAFAQQPNHSNTVSVFVSDLAISHSAEAGTNLETSYGAAFGHMFNRNWSAELSVTSQPLQETSIIVVNQQAIYSTFRDKLYPVDANISYHFLTGSRWKPYVGGGLRYLDFKTRLDLPTGVQRLSQRFVDPEVSGGVTFQIRPNLGLRFDAKRIIGTSYSVLGDSALSGSVGLSFGF
ncbi:MAG TPA: OmpW family outer membrane protein [Thermoanaerobaculia bacterium]|jgi:outer membrane protein W|nr:OmpW family outer membrane protein [Thermoanaerobaculia bacterium]